MLSTSLHPRPRPRPRPRPHVCCCARVPRGLPVEGFGTSSLIGRERVRVSALASSPSHAYLAEITGTGVHLALAYAIARIVHVAIPGPLIAKFWAQHCMGGERQLPDDNATTEEAARLDQALDKRKEMMKNNFFQSIPGQLIHPFFFFEIFRALCRCIPTPQRSAACV